MNLKYPEKMKLESCEEIEIKPYLLLEEEGYIIEQLKDIDNFIEREYNLDCLLLQLACDINEPMDYDLLKANGIFEEIRFILSDNIEEINKAIEYENSLNKTMKEFLTDMSKLADKAIKKIPSQNKLEKALESLSKRQFKILDSTNE